MISPSRLAQFPQQPVPVVQVHHLQLLEFLQERFRFGRVVTVALELCDEVELTRNVPFAVRDMALGLIQAIGQKRAIHFFEF